MWYRVRHQGARGLLRAVACTAALAVPGSGFAQPLSPQAITDSPAIELAATVAGTHPAVIVVDCCQLRTPPQFVKTDARYCIVSLGAEARLYWARRLSALVYLSWSGNAGHDVAYARPPSAPPPLIPGSESLYVADKHAQRRGWTLAIVQSIDVARSKRWRPWLGGGLASNVSANITNSAAPRFLIRRARSSLPTTGNRRSPQASRLAASGSMSGRESSWLATGLCACTSAPNRSVRRSPRGELELVLDCDLVRANSAV